MLFMVIEHFRNGEPTPIGKRFRERGRMMPDGVAYHASWVDPAGARCFQLMEAESEVMLRPWIDAWADLVEFEVVPVKTSRDYWAALSGGAEEGLAEP
jgi:hypothetical protein